MSKTVQNCDQQKKPETICERLGRKIDEFINRERKFPKDGTKGLKHRFTEQVSPGAQGPGTEVWIKHEKAILEQQKALRNLLEDYDNNDCDQKGPPLPDRARNWAF